MRAMIGYVLLAYLVGSINPSYLIGRFQGFDIRGSGSGNAGGSNALIVMGKKIGALCMVLDILKCAVLVRLAIHVFPEAPSVWTLTAVACTLGHMFPFYMGFKGGKGLACLGGTIIGLSSFPVFAAFFMVELVMAIAVDYLCIVPITACIAYPVFYGVVNHTVLQPLLLMLIAIPMLCKHHENIRRIRSHQEAHFSFLWKKDKEIERLKDAGANTIDPKA